MSGQSKTKEEPVIARVVLVPKSHWKALGEHAKLTTGKTDRSTIIRKLIRSFVQQTGALRRLKADAARRRKAREEREATAAAPAKAKAKGKAAPKAKAAKARKRRAA